jgi:hypothetical protein
MQTHIGGGIQTRGGRSRWGGRRLGSPSRLPRGHRGRCGLRGGTSGSGGKADVGRHRGKLQSSREKRSQCKWGLKRSREYLVVFTNERRGP